MDTRGILTERLAAVRGRIADACRRAGRDPAGVTLVAVSKSVSAEVAALAVEVGMTDLGESRPQELWRKAETVGSAAPAARGSADRPGPAVRWHLTGHLQRNKIDRTVPLVSLIHSVDSERLLDALADFGQGLRSPIPVLVEMNCSREPAKGGFLPESAPALADRLASLPGVSARGLMTMAAYSADPEDARPTFAELRRLRDEMRKRTGMELPHLSMGMSGDYEVAIEEGATLVRIGTALFAGL
jgi:pyridoxal phosphate enzyme (YggS family)